MLPTGVDVEYIAVDGITRFAVRGKLMRRRLSRTDIAQLHELGAMRERGILTPEEFTAQKGFVLDGEAGKKQERPGNMTMWIVGAIAILLIIVVVIGSASGGSAAHGFGRTALSN